MDINFTFLRTTGLIASVFGISFILIRTILYLAEQVDVELPNFELVGSLLSWGIVVIAFRQLGKSFLQSLGNTILSVVLVVVLGTILITTFEIGLHHYIDIDYKYRMASKQAILSQQKMRQIETERNVIFSNSSEEEYIERFTSYYTINGLVRSGVLNISISSVLLVFLVMLLAPATNLSDDY